MNCPHIASSFTLICVFYFTASSKPSQSWPWIPWFTSRSTWLQHNAVKWAASSPAWSGRPTQHPPHLQLHPLSLTSPNPKIQTCISEQLQLSLILLLLLIPGGYYEPRSVHSSSGYCEWDRYMLLQEGKCEKLLSKLPAMIVSIVSRQFMWYI